MDQACVDDIRRLIGHPVLLRMYDYWLTKHPPGRLPGRQHIDPLEFPYALPNILLFDVYRDPLRFRVRVCGTHHTIVRGEDITGRWLEEIVTPEVFELINGDYLMLVNEHRPSYHKGPLVYRSDRYISLERILLPLARDGVNVDMIMGVTVHFDSTGHAL